MGDPRTAQHSAQVQLLFRDVNERIRSIVAELFGLAGDQEVEIVCECFRSSCSTRIGLPVDAYDRVREQPGWFLVVPGHEHPEVERVVERHQRHYVVENDGYSGAGS